METAWNNRSEVGRGCEGEALRRHDVEYILGRERRAQLLDRQRGAVRRVAQPALGRLTAALVEHGDEAVSEIGGAAPNKSLDLVLGGQPVHARRMQSVAARPFERGQ